ncbi:CO or xanthine dehydrogenase, Mo-binding subunit [Granulicella rosea]|uniref:CO or xanthine dehydrogenase, Mo-binding subunit n=1 Tax=Granulicella rosea TaxID=474952 RepID=A0A239KWH3_9BACT|nr:xanthine dehydrogenase family protein molybdopterin-binding subunit [Granulicella rosea]SNT21859.1 CO or xanthine dehydrogenase, Mo-binding subunit [Granulicella rosea]
MPETIQPAQLVGSNPIRKEGRAKVLGQARYVDDITMPEMWYGATVRSNIARGRILSISFPPEIPWHEFTIVSAKDIPGENTIVHLTKDHPCLAAEYINHPDEPILLLAHPDKRVLPAAVAAVKIEYEVYPAVFTIEESEAEDGPQVWNPNPADVAHHHHLKNTFKTYLLQNGDPDEAFAAADFIIEGEYHTGAQEQLYIENNGIIGEYLGDEGVKVQGSMQCPYYVVHALELVFDLPREKCRVIQTETGGAFGGKEDFPSVIASHAALLAMKCGHPVKICYDRGEDMVGTTKRHPSRTRHRTAVSKDGRILGGTIDFAIDGGAYATLSPVVLSRGTIHAAGPYHWPHLIVRAKAMATNIAPHGAFRGFGAPQSLFALERHMDKIAGVLGLTPEEFRRRNFLKTGDQTATGQHLLEPVDMQALLTRALKEADYHAKIARYAESNKTDPIKRGLGFASFFHGSGFTGSGERRLNSLVEIDLTPDGRPRVLMGSTEFGQGTNTVISQVAAQALNLPYEAIVIAQPDTGHVPDSGPTVASRTTMVVGKLVERASRSLCLTLTNSGYVPRGYTPEEFQAGAIAYLAEHGECKVSARYEPVGEIFWDDEKYKGDAYPAYAWAVYVAEVAVDTRTYQATVTDFHALQEVGKVLHPILAEGQIQGGVAQGIGYAIYEKCEYKNGRMMNNQMTNYIMPTSADLPPIHVHFEETPSVQGAFGAKGIGELPMDGPAPAILNAVLNATGIAFNTIPLLPEDIFERMTRTSDTGSEALEPAVDRDTRVEAEVVA